MPVLGSAENVAPVAHVSVMFRGRKERIPVKTQSSTFRDVLVLACERFGEENAPLKCELYVLKYKSRVVDLLIPFRITGIGNNATVEMEIARPTPEGKTISSTASSGNMIRVQIRLSSGGQGRGQLSSGSTLQEMIEQLISTDNMTLISKLTYLQVSVNREAFDTTTLASMGIREGSASFSAQIEKATPSNSETKTDDSTLQVSKENIGATMDLDSTPLETKNDPPATPALSLSRCAESVAKIRDTFFDEQSREIVKTLLKIVLNLISRKGDEKVRQLKLSNASFNNRIGRFPVAVDVLYSIGFQQTEERCLVLHPSLEDDKLLQATANKLADLGVEVGIPSIEVEEMMRSAIMAPKVASRRTTTEMEVDEAAPVTFDPYKSNVHRLAPQPRGGESAIDREVRLLKERHDRILEEAGIPERKAMIIPFQPNSSFNPRQFSSHEQVTRSSLEDDDDSMGDMSLLMQASKVQRAKQKESENFRTKAMRDLDMLKSARVFKSTIIRVLFPDRLVFQAYFSPQETISDLAALVNDILVDSAKGGFEFYTTPPLQVLSMKETFQVLRLIPAAVIHLRWTKGTQSQTPLDPLASEPLIRTDANEITAALPEPIHIAPKGNSSESSTSLEPDEGSLLESSSKKVPPVSKKPKWFNL